MSLLFYLAACYLLGGIPSGYLAGKWFQGIDIRSQGSGNMGATNVFRVLGAKAGAMVLLADIIKGVLAVTLLSNLFGPFQGLPLLGGALAAVLGHNYTPFLDFKGGKGVATSAGVCLGLAPWATVTVLGVFLVVFGLSRMVSAGSIVAATLLPVAMWYYGEAWIALGLLLAAFVWVRHIPNIKRIMAGTENQFGEETVNESAFIIGSGGWGTALGLVLARQFADVRLYEHDAAYAAEVEASRENKHYLKGVSLAENMHFQADDAGLAEASLVLLVAPSQYLRSVIAKLAPKVPAGVLLVVATKGIEPGSLLTMGQVVQEEFRKAKLPSPRLVTLSGPSHAEEVGRGLPTTVVAAADKLADALECQQAFNSPVFRVYTSDDHLGVELGGSLKNVVALAAGVADGLGLGDNAKAALMTRGLAEITRLGVALGAKPATFAGLTGMGDLVVTCMSRHSRNRSVGERLGKGESWADIKASMKMVAEGIVTAASAHELAQRYHVELPICDAVYRIVYEAQPAATALQELLRREPKGEDR